MSVLVNEKTRVIVQGLTGREGSFHAEQMLAYGTKVVGGVTPGKGGTKHLDVPVFNTVADAVKATGAIDGQAVGLIQLCGTGRPAIARKAGHTCAGDGLDGTIRRDLADPVVGGIGEVDVSGTVHRDSFGLGQRGRESWAAIA